MIRTTPTLSVFTPAYNRAHTIGHTYESLRRQTSKDFKWVIVDDGSTDGTEELVKPWLGADNGFVIEYYKKENGGMHTAHNEAYKHIDTELAVCIDSDDWMPDDGVEIIINKWHSESDDKCCGIIGLDVYADSMDVVGTKFPEDLQRCKVFDLRRKYGVVGDKKYVLKTEIIKQYLPYPVFDDERNMSVNYPYSQMSIKYDFLCCNMILCIVEYHPDGLTKGIFKQYINSPNSFLYTRNIYMEHLPYWQDRFRSAIHYVSSAIFAKRKDFLSYATRKIIVVFAMPFGVILNLYVRYKNRK